MRWRGLGRDLAGLVLVVFVFGCSAKDNRGTLSYDSVERVLLGFGTATEQNELAIESTRQVNAAVEACMRDQGFEWYQPDPASGVTLYDGPDRGSLDFAKEFGFGVSTTFTVGHRPGSDPAEEKNLHYMSSLTRVGQARYSDAYQRCESAAATDETAGVAAMTKSFNEKFERVRTSAEFSQAIATWRSCVGEVGIQAASLDDLVVSFVPRANGDTAEDIEDVRSDERRIATLTFPCDDAYRSTLAGLVEG
mgnify:CR=1 FL=1